MEGFVPWPDELATRYRSLGLWEGVTVGGLLARSAQRWPHKLALVHGTQRLSYAELLARCQDLAARFCALGLRPGERVLLQLPNTVDFVLSYFALNLAGVIPVMALRAHRHAEVRHFLRASGAVAYIVPDVLGSFDFRSMAAQMQSEFADLRHVLVSGEPAPGQQALADLPPATSTPAGPGPGDVSTMLLSGGTTSLSKLIPRTHDDYVLNARLCGAAAGFDQNTVLLAILPLGHNYNLASPGMLGCFYFGGTVVLATGTSVEEIFTTIARERVTVAAAVIPLITAWVNSDALAAHDLSSLKVVQNGGARLAPELRRRLRERLHCTPQEIYGTAEGLINMTRLDDAEDLLMESSGAPVCDEDEIRVVDDAGHDVPDGEPGELVTRGPYTIRGYYNAPAKNSQAFLPGGWYRMGDIVRKLGRHVFSFLAGLVDSIVGGGGLILVPALFATFPQPTRHAAGHEQERFGLGHGHRRAAVQPAVQIDWAVLLPAAATALLGACGRRLGGDAGRRRLPAQAAALHPAGRAGLHTGQEEPRRSACTAAFAARRGGHRLQHRRPARLVRRLLRPRHRQLLHLPAGALPGL
jgi:2,3-dihydroxybenzoate-AMP ligase